MASISTVSGSNAKSSYNTFSTQLANPARINNGIIQGSRSYNTPLDYMTSNGISMSDAIALDILDRIYNPKPMQTPVGKKEHPNQFQMYDKLDGGIKMDISRLFQPDEFKEERELKKLDGTDTPSLINHSDIAEKQHSRFNSMLNKYNNYHLFTYSPYFQNGHQKGIGLFQKDNEVTTYTFNKSQKQSHKDSLKQDYEPFNLNTNQLNEAEKKPAYSAVELMAYQILVNQHAYQGFQGNNNSLSYLSKNKDDEIRVTEGTGSGIGYLTLSIARQYEELQRYTLMIKYDDEKPRKALVDDSITEGMDELLAQFSEKEAVSTEDIIQMLVKILEKRKETDENLALTEVQFKSLQSSLKEQLKIESHDNVKSMILMLEIEKSLKLKQLIIRKKPEKNEEIANEEPKKEISYKYLPSYLGTIADYIKKLEKKRNDFTMRAPFKVVHKFPVNLMGGVLGFTYLGENFMGIRDDLYGPELHEVELHEAIHTPDEYETRVLTKWMLDNETKYH